MISKSSISKLKEMGIDTDALIAAMKDAKEVNVNIPDGTFLTDDKIAELKNNVKQGHEQAYPEIWGKNLNKEYELGLSTTDAKDHKKVIEALKNKTLQEADKHPDAKVKELEASIKKLQEEVIPSYETKAKEWQSKYQEREIYDKYASLIPEKANKFLTKDEHINRIKSMYEITEKGTLIDKSTKMPVKDKLERELPANEVITELYKTKEGWLQPDAEPAKGVFSHSTNGNGIGGNKRGNFDYDAKLAEVTAKYNMNDREQRSMAMAELTAAQINAAKN